MLDLLPTPGEAYYVVEWVVRLVMLAVVPFRRTAAVSRSWLLLVFFLPIPGLLLFLAIGSARFPRWRAARFNQLAPAFADFASGLPRMAQPGPGTPADITALTDRLGHLPAVGGNALELIADYDTAVARLIVDIDAAKHEVRILVYIFADDEIGLRVIAALARAVARGVRCHVLIDPVGSHRWIYGTLRKLAEAGVAARATLPFHLVRGRTRRDMRNHRKLFIIDGAVGYAGSQNIVAKDLRPGVVNEELVARVCGPIVAAMNMLFVADWYLESAELLDATGIPTPKGSATMQVLPSGADYPLAGLQTLLTWQVHRAQREVVIVTPYLIPDESFIEALGTAVLRGVKVQIVVSAIADQKLVNLAQCSYYAELLDCGVTIHLYRDCLLHAKNVRIDDRLGIIGSSNVDIRSFQLNEEVSLLLFSNLDVAALRAIQDGYLSTSDTICLDAWGERSWMRKLAENAARLVSPLL